MYFSIANSRTSKAWQLIDIAFDDFLNKYIPKQPMRTAETVSEYQKMSKTEKGKIKDVGGFVAGKLKNGRRIKGAVELRSAAVVDVDYGNTDLIKEFIARFNGRVVSYTTHSHTLENPRFRVIIPLEKTITAGEYKVLINILMSNIGLERCDKGSNQPERLMYFPSCPKDGQYDYYDNEKKNYLDAKKYILKYIDTLPAPTTLEAVVKKERGLDKKGPIGSFCRNYSIQDVIEKFLPDIYVGSDNRYTYVEGTSFGGLVIYDDGEECTSFHGTDPLNDGHSHNAFDLLLAHKFKGDEVTALRFVSKLDPVCRELAKEAISDSYPELAAAVEKAAAKKTISRVPDVDKNGLMCTINNYVLALEGLGHEIKYNEFTMLYELDNKNYQNSMDSKLLDDIEKKYKFYSKDKIQNALEVLAMENKYNPVQEYLTKLKWNGVRRVETLLIDYFGSPNTPYTKAVTRKFLCGAVKRVFNPGCEFQHILVLRGPQNVGKSTFLSMLAKNWFNDSFQLTDTRDKTGPEKLIGSWFIEIAEMAGMKKAETETIKSFATRRFDRYRPSYGRKVEQIERQSIFVGTTNATSGYLKDITGNRRFWDVETPTRLTDELDVDQIWAEVMTMYEKEELRLSKELEKEAARIQDSQLETEDKYELLQDYLEMKVPLNWETMSSLERKLFIHGTKEEKAKALAKGGKYQDRFNTTEIWIDVMQGKIKDLTSWESKNIVAYLRKAGFTKAAKKLYMGGRIRAWTK